MTALVHPILFLNTAFNRVKNTTAMKMSRAGVKQEINILKMKSEEPNRFNRVSFKKQSYETIISELEPSVLTGERAFIKNAG